MFRLKVIYTAVSNDYMLGRINEIHRVHTESIYIYNKCNHVTAAHLHLSVTLKAVEARRPSRSNPASAEPWLPGLHRVCACSPALPSLTLDTQCTLDTDCPPTQACISGQCKDPCTVRGACGERALCQTVAHAAQCSCPQCYVGRPKVACRPDPTCDVSPKDPPITTGCRGDSECPDSQACDRAQSQCYDPCVRGGSLCEANKMCEVRKHEPTCICKHGFVVNSVGEFVCATGPIECRANDECASNLACVNNKCVNPCSVGQPCPPSKQCDVLNHQPVCICVKDCNPSVTICLRDEGCGPTEACVSYQCVDPCASHVCPGDTPCYVEDHKPLCKFCPPGFTVDPEFGCVKGKHFAQCSRP